MPPSAARNRPGLSAIAPVKAPLTWPNSSDSSSVSGSAPQLTSTNGLSRRGRAVVDRAGEQRFARAAFAGHQHRRAAVGDGFDQVEDLEHLVVVADDVFQAEAQVELLAQRLVLEQQRLLAHGLLDDDADLVIDDRLGEIVERAHLGRFDRAFDRAVAGDDDDDDVRESPADVAQKLGAA